MYTVTSLAWRPNGSTLALGSLCGLVDTYEACVKRYGYKCFEVTYVSPSQVLIRRKDGKESFTIKSKHGEEITKIMTHQDEEKIERFVVAHTEETLIVGDMGDKSGKISEIPWDGNGENEKYFFDAANACLVSYGGEISIIEYGTTDILASVRTENTSSHLLSVRINERPPRLGEDNPDTPRVDDDEGGTLCCAVS